MNNHCLQPCAWDTCFARTEFGRWTRKSYVNLERSKCQTPNCWGHLWPDAFATRRFPASKNWNTSMRDQALLPWWATTWIWPGPWGLFDAIDGIVKCRQNTVNTCSKFPFLDFQMIWGRRWWNRKGWKELSFVRRNSFSLACVEVWQLKIYCL